MPITVTHAFVSPKTEQTDPTIVGPNEWNAQHVVTGYVDPPPPVVLPTVPYLVTSDYNFAEQWFTQPLSAGVQATVTISPVPKGVYGNDANHYLYISPVSGQGTGTAEAVLIQGGTANGGGTSGTIIFTPANNHTGVWRLTSATAGIQETLRMLPYPGGWAIIPAGGWSIFAPITVNTSGIKLQGAGRINTQLNYQLTAGACFSIPGSNDQITMSDFQLNGSGGSAIGLNLVNQSNFNCQRMAIVGFATGVSNTGNSNTQMSLFRDMNIMNNSGDAVYIDTTIDGGTWERIVIGGPGNGFHIRDAVGAHITHCYTNGCAIGALIDPVSPRSVGVIQFVDTNFDGFSGTSNMGIRLSPASGATINTVIFQGGGAGGFNYGFMMDGAGTIWDITFRDMLILANNVVGGQIGQSTLAKCDNILVKDCYFEANSAGSPGANPGLNIQYATNVQVHGGVYCAGSYANGANTQGYGITVAGATTNVQIFNLRVNPNVAGSIQQAGTNTNLVIQNVL